MRQTKHCSCFNNERELGTNEILGRTVASETLHLIRHSVLQASNRDFDCLPLLIANSYGLGIYKSKNMVI